MKQPADNEIKFGDRTFEGVPKHVAIICDGNRRYAEKHGLSVQEGHAKGAENVLELAKRAGELGVHTVTVWVGDTKNIKKRSKEEVRNLLKLLLHYLMRFKKEFLDQDIRFRHIGARKFLPKKIVNLINELEAETAEKKTATLNIAFNYGGRDEIVRVVQKIVADGIDPEDITEELISEYLDTADIGDPDMIIRTGNEIRLSGFMPWQSAPAELFFAPDLFPEFTPDRFEEVVREFPTRRRRLGA
ncbi:MAG: isoprenyl transferase [Candidatus Dojkabacteria bacterium]